MAKDSEYRIAFAFKHGWEIAEQFMAPDEETANDYAANFYAGDAWYVLDANGRDINSKKPSRVEPNRRNDR